ncbi:MAG: DUF1343 domain-containing protein [Acidobacteria bacterium]|jgi:uncharacterized protein YbbC (DUF1343 family)|nr:DUF1343 domain-containing protein [Acidobacteriota bacterium]
MIRNGIDILPAVYGKLVGRRNIALVTGSANIDAAGRPVHEVVGRLAGNRLKAIWSLQHGFFIDKQDNMVLSPSFFWSARGAEVRSLYGEKLLPDPEWLRGIGLLVVDPFDTGTRVYTFVNHLAMLLRWLSGRGVEMVVLDRPNPLNGRDREGNVALADHFSIVAQLPVPMRHGLTAGEFLSYALSYYGLDVPLTVVQARGWTRRKYFANSWTLPSPNMPSFATAVVYPGAVLLEGTNLSEGRGTTRPFELVGAPFIDPFRLASELKPLKLPGVRFVPMFFKPEFSKHGGRVCGGVLVQVTDRDRFRSFRTYYELIRLAARLHPEGFHWQQPPYEFEYLRPPMDMICGSEQIRKAIDKNIPFTGIRDGIEREIHAYAEAVRPFLLYS